MTKTYRVYFTEAYSDEHIKYMTEVLHRLGLTTIYNDKELGEVVIMYVTNEYAKILEHMSNCDMWIAEELKDF